jgi:hypothetical protein
VRLVMLLPLLAVISLVACSFVDSNKDVGSAKITEVKSVVTPTVMPTPTLPTPTPADTDTEVVAGATEHQHETLSDTKTKTLSGGGKQCILSGGETVNFGWVGKGTGDNFCNNCFCNINGGLACTKMACSFRDIGTEESDGPIVEIPFDLGNIPQEIPDELITQIGKMMSGAGDALPEDFIQDPCAQMPVAVRPMCTMMLERSQSMDPGMSNMGRDNTPPILYNLLIENFDHYDPVSSRMGPFKFSENFAKGSNPTVFDEFGRVHDAGKPGEYENPTFEYKFPSGTELISPVDGMVEGIAWQPTGSYKQDDWELIIKPSRSSAWRISIDHIVSLLCDLEASKVCEEPLVINGEEVRSGMSIKVGDKIGYAGNWVDTTNSGVVERTEITVGRFDGDTFENYCPIKYLHESVKQSYRDSISGLMDSYEEWSGDMGIYSQDKMVEPGCLYEQINEINGVITVVK